MAKVDRKAFAVRVNTLRETCELSWKQLAARVGSLAALRNWKRGRSWPRTETIVALSEALGVTTDYLLTGTEPVNRPFSEPQLLDLKEAIEAIPWELRKALAYALLGRSHITASCSNDGHPRPERNS